MPHNLHHERKQMARDDQPWYLKTDPALPKDMERRRVADLEKFRKNNPNYQWPTEQQIDEVIDQIGGFSVPPSVFSSAMRRERPKSAKGVTWTVEKILELLEEMKVYVQKHKLKWIGSDFEKWKAIATHLPNPSGLELQKHAQSCEALFRSLRREVKTAPIEIQQSMSEYFRICGHNKSLMMSKRSSPTEEGTREFGGRHKSVGREESQDDSDDD